MDTAGGINPTFNAESPFADNGRIPHGLRVAFGQSSGNVAHDLSTVITDLSPGLIYRVTFRANSRAAKSLPTSSWSLNGGAFVPFSSNPDGGDNEYNTISGEFLATAETAALVIRNQTADDSAVLVDLFEITMAP